MRTNEVFLRENSYARGIGLADTRPTQRTGWTPPPGTTIVSADGHLALAEDIFIDRFPAHLRAKAPRIWFDEATGFNHIGDADKKSYYPPVSHPMVKSIEGRASTADMNARMKDNDDEGVDKEIVFPQTISMYLHWPDFEVREAVLRVYNQYIASLQARFPTRFFPVGFGLYWDPPRAAEWIKEIKALGLKTYMIPMNPGKGLDGKQLFYAAANMDPLWTAIEEAGLPMCFHIGESLDQRGPAALVVEAMSQLGGGAGNFRKLFTELVFGGVFDRHPKLKILFAEGGINWVVSTLQDAEMAHDSYAALLDYKPKHRPSRYWYEHCHASFMNDAVGLRQLDVIGPDCAMWSSDYPHNEGTIGYSRTSMKRVADMCSAADTKKILGGNALKLFNLS
jgi:predicted TIM-barrel fold metal-dependent hydrolase